MVRTSLLVPTLTLAACIGGGGNGKNKVSTDNGITTTQFTTTSGSDGVASIEVEVDGSVDVFHVYAVSEEYVSVEGVYDPSGNLVLDWQDWDGNNSLTSAVFLEGTDTILNWPVREADGPLAAGTWTVDVATVNSDYYYTSADVDVTVQTREEDDEFLTATVDVEIVFAGTVGEDDAVVSATESAVSRWEEVWGEYGLSLKASYRYATELDEKLNDLDSGGSSTIKSESAEGTDNDIMVLIGESIGNYTDVYGIAGGIPGTPVAGRRSTVVISWLANAGGDGQFSEDDIRLYGETLAHEVGHYTGLFHPVEDGWSYYDALADTSECSSTSRCEEDLGDNLMFPYPICSFTSCTPQDQISAAQQGVMHRYIGAY